MNRSIGQAIKTRYAGKGSTPQKEIREQICRAISQRFGSTNLSAERLKNIELGRTPISALELFQLSLVLGFSIEEIYVDELLPQGPNPLVPGSSNQQVLDRIHQNSPFIRTRRKWINAKNDLQRVLMILRQCNNLSEFAHALVRSVITAWRESSVNENIRLTAAEVKIVLDYFSMQTRLELTNLINTSVTISNRDSFHSEVHDETQDLVSSYVGLYDLWKEPASLVVAELFSPLLGGERFTVEQVAEKLEHMDNTSFYNTEPVPQNSSEYSEIEQQHLAFIEVCERKAAQ